MLSLQGVVIESAVDWITCTAKTPLQQDRIRHRAQSLLLSEIQTGQEIRPWNHKGYVGFTTGHCDLGTRHDSTIVRLHGHLAGTDWWDVFQEAENTSRLDVQVTVQNDSDDGCVLVHKAHEVARQHKLHGKLQQWHLRTDSSRGDTLYLGRQTSDTFLRIYCKAHESGLDHYARCVRVEAQFNRHLARQYASALADGRVVQEGCSSFLQNLAQARGIVLPTIAATCHNVRWSRLAGDRRSWLEWIAKCVRPRLERDISRFGKRDAYAALGILDDLKPEGPESRHPGDWVN